MYLYMDLNENYYIKDFISEINMKIEKYLNLYPKLRIGYCFHDNDERLIYTYYWDNQTSKNDRKHMVSYRNANFFDIVSCLDTNEKFSKFLFKIKKKQCHIRPVRLNFFSFL